MSIDETKAERLIFLLKAQAKNFGEMERNMIALARTLECMFDIDTEKTVESKPANGAMVFENGRRRFIDPHNPIIALNGQESASASISGKTLTVQPEDPLGPKLIKRFPDGKELWAQPCGNSGLSVCADNKWMVSHPSDATEELLERLQEDHGA